MNMERLLNINPLRKLMYAIIGLFTFPGIAIVNRIKITGTEYLKNLPKKNDYPKEYKMIPKISKIPPKFDKISSVANWEYF